MEKCTCTCGVMVATCDETWKNYICRHVCPGDVLNVLIRSILRPFSHRNPSHECKMHSLKINGINKMQTALCINLTQTCYQLLLTNYFHTIKTYTTTPHESHTISIYLTPIPPWHLDQSDTMAQIHETLYQNH